MNSITVNGEKFDVAGKNVTITNGKVTVDGKVITENKSRNLEVTVEGDVDNLKCDGNVACKNVTKDVDAGGNVTCEDVGGYVDAGGSVQGGSVKGYIDAGGSVVIN